MNRSKVLKNVAVWVPTVLLGLMYIMQGLMKFDPKVSWEAMFASWGYPSPSHLVVGALEVLGGAGLFIPRLAGYAAALLAIVMLGAFGTHLLHMEVPGTIATGIFTVILVLLARARWSRRLGGSTSEPTAKHGEVLTEG